MFIYRVAYLGIASALLFGCGPKQRDAAQQSPDTSGATPTVTAMRPSVPAIQRDSTLRAPDRFVPSVADTFDLVSVDGGAVPLPIPPANAQCPVHRLFWQRLVFAPNSRYESMTGSKFGCGQDLTRPDSAPRRGRYSISGDTLTGFVGDGDEEFVDFYLRVWRDSLSGGPEGNGRYVRRGSHAAQR
jgi:hypothetical protein